MNEEFTAVVEATLRAAFTEIAQASKGKIGADEVARLFRTKATELLAELERGPVSWDNAPYCDIREVFRPGMIDRIVRLQAAVERLAVPRPLMVTDGDERFEEVVTEVTLVDASRSAVHSLPITASDIVSKLDDLRVKGRQFEVLGVVTAVGVAWERHFRLLVLDVRPIDTALTRIQATALEVQRAEAQLGRLRAQRRRVFDYVRQRVCSELGIIEVDDDEFACAIDSTIIAAFSCGHVSGTPGNIHHLVVGPSGIGKKLLAQIARVLHPTGSEIGVVKVTEAGLVGVASRKSGVWHHTPGLLPSAHGGVFVLEDAHELNNSTRRSLVGTLLKLMEDGRVIDSTAAATTYEVNTSVHFDQNVAADVWNGDAVAKLTFRTLRLPKHFLGRSDLVSCLPRDPGRQRELACRIAEAPEETSRDRSWQRELRVLVAYLRDHFPEPSLDEVASLMGDAMQQLCQANPIAVEAAPHFDDFLTRMAISLRKMVKAICRSRAVNMATSKEVAEATRLLQAKVNFLAQLEPGVVSPSGWSRQEDRQAGIRDEFGGQEVTVEDVAASCQEHGSNVSERTVRRDLVALGGRLVAKGRWLLPGP